MRASELTLGSWVIATNNGVCPLPGKIAEMLPRAGRVVGIDGDGVWLSFVDFFFMLDAIEPVPLTPEILEKNGWKHEFDKKPYMTFYHLEDEKYWLMWCISEHTLDIQRQNITLLDQYNLCAERAVIACNYVHQLQHALRLCGIEKEIVL